MPVATLLGHDRIPQDPHRRAPDGLALERRQLHRVGGDDRHLVVLEDDHVTGAGEDRGDIGGDEHLALPEPHHDGASTLLCDDQPVRCGG